MHVEPTADSSSSGGMLPTPFDEKVDQIHGDNLGCNNIDTETLRARVVADIITSMTEQQMMELYDRVTGHLPGE
ncbi:hypothetical protein GCM10022627_37040 [Haloarcula argentinensis]